MRISSLQVFNIARNGMADVNQDLVKTQEQLATGRRILTPSDDPIAASKMLQISDELANIDQYKKNINAAETGLVLEESVLDGVNNLLTRMQELSVAAGNTASLSENEYRGMSAEVGTRIDELLNLMNTRNANGDFIFGGYKSVTEPFTGDVNNGFRYEGDEGQQAFKVANNTTVVASNSGKAIFMDIGSAENTIQTYPSPGNQSSPPVTISVGQVVNQDVFDDFFPKDMAVTFNADSAINPPTKNYTITERGSGRVLVANEPYIPGEEILANGVSFRIAGTPASGQPAVAATRPFGLEAVPVFPVDFSAPGQETFTLTVAGRTQTLALDANITNAVDLALVLNDAVNGNAEKLAELGVAVTDRGFEMPLGVNMRIANGTATIDALMGLNTSAGSSSENGMLKQPGDRLFIDSTEKQSVLTTLARFKEALDNYTGDEQGNDLMAEAVASTLDNLSYAQDSVLDTMAGVGARMNTLDSTRNLHLDTELVGQTMLSDIRDLDYAEASTRLAQQTLILQAAQQSFIRVSQLSLFDRL